MGTHIKRISPTETIPVRHVVLWPDLAPADVVLEEDATGFHFGAFLLPTEAGESGSETGESSASVIGHTQQPIAVISAFLEDWPSRPVADDCHSSSSSGVGVRFRKFACTLSNRSQGIGTRLLNHVVNFARDELKGDYLWCDARVETIGWYERRGMVRDLNADGKEDVFLKKGKEYIRMRMELKLGGTLTDSEPGSDGR